MGQLTAEEARRHYYLLLCARCLRRCESHIEDTMEYDEHGELTFHVEIYCPNCNIRDTITRVGGAITRMSDGPSISPAEWRRSVEHVARFGIPVGGQDDIVVRPTDRGGEGSIQSKGISGTPAQVARALIKLESDHPSFRQWADERKRAYYRERHAWKHRRRPSKRKMEREPTASD